METRYVYPDSQDVRLVFSLPMRDGNKPAHEPIIVVRKVFSLPMRDGNTIDVETTGLRIWQFLVFL